MPSAYRSAARSLMALTSGAGRESCGPGQQREIGRGRVGSIDTVCLGPAAPQLSALVPGQRQALRGEGRQQRGIDLRVRASERDEGIVAQLGDDSGLSAGA